MNIPNENYLGSIIHLYNGLNFKVKFSLSTEEYQYLRKKYNVQKIVPRNQRICWKCDKSTVSKNIKSTNLCDDCYKNSANQYYYNYHRLISIDSVPMIYKVYTGKIYDK